MFNLLKPIDWTIERVIWIGYIKNEQNKKQCKLAMLPKDVINHILKFLKVQFVFERF